MRYFVVESLDWHELPNKDITNLFNAQLPLLCGDQQRLQQILINVIKLQVKHSSHNKWFIRISVAYDYQEGELRIKVHNKGNQIDRRLLHRLNQMVWGKNDLFKGHEHSDKRLDVTKWLVDYYGG